MAENDSDTKRLKEELIKRIDAEKKSPSQRAGIVFDILRNTDLTNWDVVCFCVEYLGLMIESMPWIEGEAKSLSRMVYTQHYMMNDNVLEGMKLKK